MTPERWAIWYPDRVVAGMSAEEYKDAPADDVQVIAAQPGYAAPHLSPWAHVWRWRLWTGLGEYDPFGWGIKYGALLPDEEYRRIWREVVDAYR